MCLHVSKKVLNPTRATADKVVYKILRLQRSTEVLTNMGMAILGNRPVSVIACQPYKLISEVQNFNYILGYTYHERRFKKPHHGTINEGFHAYTAKPETLKKRFAARLATGFVLVKCIIPKGALYFTGTNNGHTKGICSNKIKLVEIVQ